MDKFLSLCRLAIDLHLKGGADEDQLARLRAWLSTRDGRRVVDDLDRLFEEFDIPIVIAIRR